MSFCRGLDFSCSDSGFISSCLMALSEAFRSRSSSSSKSRHPAPFLGSAGGHRGPRHAGRPLSPSSSPAWSVVAVGGAFSASPRHRGGGVGPPSCFRKVPTACILTLNRPCIPGVNPTRSWCMIPRIYCWVWCTVTFLRTFVSIFKIRYDLFLLCLWLSIRAVLAS